MSNIKKAMTNFKFFFCRAEVTHVTLLVDKDAHIYTYAVGNTYCLRSCCTSIWMRSHVNGIPYEWDPIWMLKWHSKCNRLYVDMNEIACACDLIWMWSHMNEIRIASDLIHIHMGSHSYGITFIWDLNEWDPYSFRSDSDHFQRCFRSILCNAKVTYVTLLLHKVMSNMK